MINDLQASKSCYFFRQSESLTDNAIIELFKDVRHGQSNPSRNHFSHNRKSYNGALWSALCFSFDRSPTFLPDSKVTDRVTGYLMIVEYLNHVAVFKSQLDLTSGFVKKYLVRIGAQQIDRGLTSKTSVFDRVRLRHMSVSRMALRAKTLEGVDLQNNVGFASSSRFAPLGYSFRASNEHYSTTPRTGRISLRSDRAGHNDLIDFARDIIDRIQPKSGKPPSSPFLNAFAQPLELSQLTSPPRQISIDTAILNQAIFDDATIRFVEPFGNGYRELSKVRVESVLQALTRVLDVNVVRSRWVITDPTSGNEVGEIVKNKTRISLKRLVFSSIQGVSVESKQFAVGADNDRMPLKRYLDRNEAFILLFDEPRLAYIDGSLYQDNSLADGGSTFLGYLFPNPSLSGLVDEKGTFSSSHTTFDVNTTFGAVLSSIASDDDALVCDDLNEEWADFIGFRTNASTPRVTFYHAKHGPLSLGASTFHVAISQAIKNLGNLALPAARMGGKYRRWNANYANKKSRTQISRICRGNSASVKLAVDFCRSAPHTSKRVAIVTSSLSKRAVGKAFGDIKKGLPANPYFVQLYWLLSSFFAACTEVGAFGCVICQK
ncbi:hypothetical protein [Pseudomonas alliivorans]|uniref:hypothetical protein n=1 Tax=Pseudomonas alliivorans TaxID=2810613 RepID=UPI00209062DF|nr:hypothetical protein [Pseudomonas alliivorans]MCO5367806.1 hypothetical protein [Pseudomonas alliivorans]MEE4896699.1 hypothetical protein [Pseudomonas alliivorans]